MQFTNLLAALCLAAATSAAPSSTRTTNTRALNQSLHKRGDVLTISSSNACWPMTDGSASCEQNSYIHTGNGLGSCNDPPTSFEPNMCTADGTISTPAGAATWTRAQGCSDTSANGTPMGTLRAGNTVYNCVKASGSFSLDCGEEYASQVEMVCTN